MSEINPYDQPAHRQWVESGHCPSIHWTKAWCNGAADHLGDHWAPYVNASGREVRRTTWVFDQWPKDSAESGETAGR